MNWKAKVVIRWSFAVALMVDRAWEVALLLEKMRSVRRAERHSETGDRLTSVRLFECHAIATTLFVIDILGIPAVESLLMYTLLLIEWKSDFFKSCLVFQVRSLKMKIVASLSSDSMGAGSSAKPHLRLYITVATAVFQPVIIYWLTSHLVRWPWGVSKSEFPKERGKKEETFEYLYTCVYKVFSLQSNI